MANGRIKGKVFERNIARDLLQACRKGGLNVSPVDCFRTPLSGGHVFASKKDPGDLQLSQIILDHLPILVECKCYREVHLERFLGSPRGPEFKWLDQVIRAAEGTGRTPILVMKGNNRGIYAVLPMKEFSFLNGIFGYITFYYQKEWWYVIRWEVFLVDHVSYKIQQELNGGKQ